jgi:hypothetical protein
MTARVELFTNWRLLYSGASVDAITFDETCRDWIDKSRQIDALLMHFSLPLVQFDQFLLDSSIN